MPQRLKVVPSVQAGVLPPLSTSDLRTLLGETAYLLLQDVDADTLAQTVFSKLKEYLPLDAFVHYLVSPDGSHLQLASAAGPANLRAALGPTLDFGQAVCGTVAQRCEWMHITDVQTRTDAMTGLIRSLGLRAYTCQPLLARGKLVGTFSFGCTTRDSFSKDELDLFQLVAEQISLATDRRLQNEQFLRLEREAAYGRMTATLAHEINNPLDSLTNLLYLLRDHVASDSGRELLGLAETEVARLGETTQRTLKMVRGETVTPKLLLVDEFLRELASTVTLPNSTPITVELESGLLVEAVAGELRQAIMNLLINAAHFSPAGESVHLCCSRHGQCVHIKVSDRGRGISEESRPNIFQPYYTTRAGGGTGLGLWASRGLMQRLGGDITFESDPAVRPGTTFTVTLPLSHPADPDNG